MKLSPFPAFGPTSTKQLAYISAKGVILKGRKAALLSMWRLIRLMRAE
jgi:hypothetical protein